MRPVRADLALCLGRPERHDQRGGLAMADHPAPAHARPAQAVRPDAVQLHRRAAGHRDVLEPACRAPCAMAGIGPGSVESRAGPLLAAKPPRGGPDPRSLAVRLRHLSSRLAQAAGAGPHLPGGRRRPRHEPAAGPGIDTGHGRCPGPGARLRRTGDIEAGFQAYARERRRRCRPSSCCRARSLPVSRRTCRHGGAIWRSG